MHRAAGLTLDASTTTFERALEQIAERAIELDGKPRFPRENFEVLMAAGIPQLAADRDRCELGEEIALVRAVASMDASTARILDGHLNGVERLALCASDALRETELQRVRQGELLIGVWGADPSPGEGPPARIEQDGGALVLKGVKTFCSGAGGVQRALVVACDEHGARRVAYVNVTSSIRIDKSWYRASGLRSSESHRVEFCDTPVLAILGGENELTREPWFSRDAVRTAATWAGIADCILRATVNTLRERELDDVRLHTIGRMRVARATIDLWLDHSASRLQAVEDIDSNMGSERNGAGSPPALAGETRVAIADAARLIAAEAARVCGSRALIDGGTLDRARRDLDLFLLQHRLDPKLVELGAGTLRGGAG
ncbi:MAG: acyl-CoA dehydrogenase family protein [Solirubrobacteraceae bacterium]